MANSSLYFLLGTISVLFLYHNTPLTTVLSLVTILFFLYVHINNYVSVDMHVKGQDLFYFISILLFEHYTVRAYLRTRFLSILGGLLTTLGFCLFGITLFYYKMFGTNVAYKGIFNYMRHPLHFALNVFLVGSSVYLGAYISFLIIVFYLKYNVCDFRVLDDAFKGQEEYLRTVPSGIPFFGTEVKVKRE